MVGIKGTLGKWFMLGVLAVTGTAFPSLPSEVRYPETNSTSFQGTMAPNAHRTDSSAGANV